MRQPHIKSGLFVVGLVIGFLLLMAAGLKVWLLLHQQYVCERKAKEAVKQFIATVAATSFESIPDTSMFVDKNQFAKFQGSRSTDYSVEIVDWLRPVEPAAAVRFAQNVSYAFTLVMGYDLLPLCWGTD